MNKYMASLYCAVAMIGVASADVLFSEDFESVSISGNTPISEFGWANDVDANDERVYAENAVWSWGSGAYLEAFYTTVGMGAGFTAIELSSVSGLTFYVDNHSQYNPGNTVGYFAIQLNGTDWYVSATPTETPTGTWTTQQLLFDPSASSWNELTVSGTGSVNQAIAFIGGSASSDLSGTITGIGYVIDRLAEGTQNFDNIAIQSDVTSTPPLAPNIAKIWMNGTTAKIYWGDVLSATNYVVKMSSTPGGPYTPVADTTNTQYWVTGLTVGETNYFVVAAENSVGQGDPSEEDSGVVQSFSIIGDDDQSWGNWLYSYKEAAFDGDTDTFYDSAETNGQSYVGIDLGEGNAMLPAELMFYPRKGSSTYRSRMIGAEFQGSEDGLIWDTLATIDSEPLEQWNAVYYNGTNTYRYVRLAFASGGYGNVAELAFSETVPAFQDITVEPANGASILGPADVTVSAQIVEWGSEFDSAFLYLNGSLVSSNTTVSGDGTNLVSYIASQLGTGSYTGKVVAVGVNPAATVTNTWIFDVVPTPSPTALALWNINIAGSESMSYPVSDGTVIAAPSTGGDEWNNLISPLEDGVDTNENTWLPTNSLSIVDADGVNPIGLKWTGTDLDWSYEDTPLDQLFIGYFGSRSFNNTMEISGLDPSAKYDIYVYFTWGWNEDWVYYSITEGSGEVMNLTLKPERDNVANGLYADIVRGQNYVIFTQLSPSAAGNIHISATSDDGGWSGLQIAEVPSSGPSLDPNIQSISISGGTVTLQWTSESGVQYSIHQKTSLTESSWTTVKSGIAGGDSSTTDSVDISGADTEFYRVEGQ